MGTVPTAPDSDYVPFYEAAEKDLGEDEGAVLIGKAPGYWNMYGDMGVSMSEVKVTGVQTFDGTAIHTWTDQSQNPPYPVSDLLNAAFDLDTSPASGRSTAVIAETISSQSIYANIFCSNVNLYDNNDKNRIYLKGKPSRFAAQLYGTWRVVNWLPAMAGSARWNSCIPMEDLSMDNQNVFSELFSSYRAYDQRKLKGVFVTFTTHEVFENRYDQKIYESNKPINNSAQATTIGSITPWYEEDLKTAITGRSLLSLNMDPYYTNTGTGNNIPLRMTPAIASLRRLSDGKAVFSLDMGNSWPEEMTPPFLQGKVQPAKRGEATFETLALGNLSPLWAVSVYGFLNAHTQPKSIQSSPKWFLIRSSLTGLIELLDENTWPCNLRVDTLFEEATYRRIITGLYAEEGDNPSDGYWVNDDSKIPCRLRIFQKGKPVTNPVNIWIVEYLVPEAANDPIGKDPAKVAVPNSVIQQLLSDNGIVQLKSDEFSIRDNAVYYFVYENQYPDIDRLPFTDPDYVVQDTGCFSCLRVYPKKDFSKYLDPPAHPEYTRPDYEVIYEEVFKLYDVVYPAMAIVHPFDKDVWDNGIMAGLIVQRTDPPNGAISL